MRIDRIPRENLSPVGRLIMDYLREQDTTMSALARACALSPSTLRKYVEQPDRQPSIITCIKLAQATDTPVADVLARAGYADVDIASLNQDGPIEQWELLQIYTALPGPYRMALMRTAHVLSDLLNHAGGTA
jgi:DNA-binding XRE family transcriptional regulator